MHLTPLIKVDFQTNLSLNTVSHFSTLDCWCEEKTSIPLDQVIKKSCETFQQKWKQAGWGPQIHNQYLQNQALVSPWSHFQFIVYYYEAPEEAESHTRCCWSGDGSTSIQPGQKTQRRISLSPIWNHEPSPTPLSPVKKLKISPEDCFFAQIYMMQAEWSNNHQAKHFSVGCRLR